MQASIEKFFKSSAYAVVGASTNRDKFGNKVLRCYQQNNKTVYPVHPLEKVSQASGCNQERKVSWLSKNAMIMGLM